MRRATGSLALALGLALAGAGLVAGCTDDGDKASFCDRIDETPAVDQILGELDTSDPGGSRERLQDGIRRFRSLEADAPGAIRADLARIRKGVELVLEAVEANPDDLSGARADIASHTDELSGLASAGQRVVAYARDECGVDLTESFVEGSGDSESGSGSGPAPTGDEATTTTAATDEGGAGG